MCTLLCVLAAVFVGTPPPVDPTTEQDPFKRKLKIPDPSLADPPVKIYYTNYPPQTGRAVVGPSSAKPTKEDLDKPPKRAPLPYHLNSKVKSTQRLLTTHEFEVAQARVLADHGKIVQIGPQGDDVGWSIQFYNPDRERTEVFIQKPNPPKAPFLEEAGFAAALEFIADHRCMARVETIDASATATRVILWDMTTVEALIKP